MKRRNKSKEISIYYWRSSIIWPERYFWVSKVTSSLTPGWYKFQNGSNFVFYVAMSDIILKDINAVRFQVHTFILETCFFQAVKWVNHFEVVWFVGDFHAHQIICWIKWGTKVYRSVVFQFHIQWKLFWTQQVKPGWYGTSHKIITLWYPNCIIFSIFGLCFRYGSLV